MDWKSMAIGVTQALNKGIPEIDERAIRNEELGMRKDAHALQLVKAKRDQELLQAIQGHVNEYRSAMGAIPSGQTAVGNAPTQTPGTSASLIPVSQEMGQPAIHEATISGAPEVSALGQQNIGSPAPGVNTPISQQGQPTSPGPMEIQTTDPVTNPPQNAQILQKRGEMMMKIHDTLLANGRFDEAAKIQKAEFDNIFAIAKISPQAAMQSWNSNPWITKRYGTISSKDLTQKGDWSFLKVGGDGLVRWNKQGQFEVVQKPTGTGGNQPTPSMYVEKSIGANTQQKFQWNPQTGQHDIPFGQPYRMHKPDSEGGGRDMGNAREFRMHMGQLNGLYKSLANIEKGVDPITQQIIPQSQIEAAKGTIMGQIHSLESLMEVDYPDQWAKYRRQPKGGGGVIGKGKQDYKANKDYNVSESADYFRENAGKYSQKAMYDKLKAAGYSDDAIKQAWRRFKGIQ